jgi:1-acyl-sn-glycerol-3-phosphate acyltransferase
MAYPGRFARTKSRLQRMNRGPVFRGLRIARAAGHGVRGLWILRRHFPGWSADQRDACTQEWARELLEILEVSVATHGEVAMPGPLLLVANHTSWLDILVILAARPARFVAKSDIRSWPLIGAVVAGAGTLFIERRQRRDALRMTQTMAEALRAGAVLAVFPEGTTGDGRALLPFHANLLQAPLIAGAPAQPVGIRFIDAATHQPTAAANYVGDDSLMGSIWRMLGAGPIRADVRFGELSHADGRTRRSWSSDLHAQVAVLCRLHDHRSDKKADGFQTGPQEALGQ